MAVDLDAELDVPSEARTLAGTAVDLSLGGARIRAGAGIRSGESVLLVLSGETDLFAGRGRVVDSDVLLSQGVIDIRVEFGSMSQATRARLGRLVASLEP